MARIKMVTRTIERTRCHCMVVDLQDISKGIYTTHLHLQGKIGNEAEAKKLLEKEYKNTLSVIKVLDLETEELLMGMPEDEFIKCAKLLDNQTRKVIEQ